MTGRAVHRLMAVAGAVLLVAGLTTGWRPVRAAPTPRPVLRVQQGRYFRYAMPSDWRANETANGVDMTAPGGATGASFALVVGMFGQATPRSYLQSVLYRSGLYQNPRILSLHVLPPQPGVMGLQWQLAEAELAFGYRGVASRAHATAGVMQGWGQYAAFIRAYQAPAARWQRDRYWLPAIAETVMITNPRQVAGVDGVRLPGPIDHDDIYGAYNKAWEKRGLSHDRISRDRQEATMGYERMMDPQTGQHYDMPLEAYDPTRGGYVNPQRPTELLQRAPPGW